MVFTLGIDGDEQPVPPGLWAAWGQASGDFSGATENTPTKVSGLGTKMSVFQAGPNQPMELISDANDGVSLTLFRAPNRKITTRTLPLPSEQTGNYFSFRTIALDLDGDGLTDVAAVGKLAPLVTTWRQLPSGAFAPPVVTSTKSIVLGQAEAFAAADMDGDGRGDLVAPTDSGGVRLLLSQGDGTFIESEWLNPSYDPIKSGPVQEIRTGDLDGDGRPEAMMAVSLEAPPLIFHNEGAGKASLLPLKGLEKIAPVTAAIGDLDGDGRGDLAFVQSQQLWVLRWLQDGTTDLVSFPLGGDFYDMRLADVDGDGKPDIIVMDNGHFSVIFNRSE